MSAPTTSTWSGSGALRGGRFRGFRLAISGDPDVEGAKPSDLVPLSLASCLAYDVVVVLARRSVRSSQLVRRHQPRSRTRLAPSPLRPHHRAFAVTGVIETAAAERSLELAREECPVLASLSPDIDIVTTITVLSRLTSGLSDLLDRAISRPDDHLRPILPLIVVTRTTASAPGSYLPGQGSYPILLRQTVEPSPAGYISIFSALTTQCAEVSV